LDIKLRIALVASQTYKSLFSPVVSFHVDDAVCIPNEECLILLEFAEQEEGPDEEEGEHEIEKVVDDDVILEEEEEDGDESGNESGSEGSEGDKRSHHRVADLGPPNFICQGCQHNAAQNQRDNLMTKWLKNNFDPRYVSIVFYSLAWFGMFLQIIIVFFHEIYIFLFILL
jgi:hypothetical protein